jgi:hypothetical protein
MREQAMTKKPQMRRSNAFKKGDPRPPNAGRAKGKRNRTTIMLKEAILKAAELCGEDGKGKQGMTGYLLMLAKKEKPVFARLLEKVLPLQLHMKDETPRQYSPKEAADRLRDRGLPVPPSLLALASPVEQASMVASVLNDEREDGKSDDLDNRRPGGSRTATFEFDDSDPFNLPAPDHEDDET